MKVREYQKTCFSIEKNKKAPFLVFARLFNISASNDLFAFCLPYFNILFDL